MNFQDDPKTILWHLHLESPITKVFQALSTDTGRASFWAESAIESEGVIHFVFPNRMRWDARILESDMYCNIMAIRSRRSLSKMMVKTALS